MDKTEPRQWPVVLGLLLAAAGILTPIFWDLLRNNSALELTQTAETVLIQRSDNLDKLKVTYDGHPVKGVTAIRFTLANTGSKPIKEIDLVEPPTINFPAPTPILDSKIESMYPSNLVASIECTTSAPTLHLHFPLLNPGDNFQFSVLIGDSVPVKFQAEARIVGISALKVAVQNQGPSRAARHGSWSLYLVGTFSLLLLIALLGTAANIPKEVRFKRLATAASAEAFQGVTKEVALSVVKDLLSWTSIPERSVVLAFLHSLPNGKLLDESDATKTANMVRVCVARATSNVTSFLICAVLEAIGVTYVVSQLL